MSAPARATSAARAAVQARAADLQRSITLSDVERVLRGAASKRDLQRAIEQVYGDQQPFIDALASALRSGWVEGNRSVRLPAATRLVTDTSLANYAAARWALDLAREQQTMLGSLVGQRVRDGYTVRDTATLIHAVMGLNPRLANAVFRRRDALVGELPRAAANRQAIAYARKLLAYRAEMIARTQANISRNLGTEMVWRAAISAGLLPLSAKRVWRVTPSEYNCGPCVELDGTAVGMNEPWVAGNGAHIYTPGMLHPHCACEEELQR